LIIPLSLSNSGCAYLAGYRSTEIPTIEEPAPVKKPEVKSVIIKYEGKYYIAYTINDSLKLYKFLTEEEAQIDKLKFRLKVLNELIQKRK
jgi:hypothetical protein